MAIEVRPATDFDDVCTMVGPKRPDATVCWCLSYRLSSKENRALTGKARGAEVKRLLKKGPLGVMAYEDDVVVGWAAVAPRAETSFARNRKIPHVDDLDVWSVWCIRVRPGHRKTGLLHHLLQGAVEYARADGVEVVHAPGEGDDSIASIAATLGEVVAVTADRGLAERVRAAGADVVGPAWLLDRLEG